VVASLCEATAQSKDPYQWHNCVNLDSGNPMRTDWLLKRVLRLRTALHK
jgi:hypothetical protein